MRTELRDFISNLFKQSRFVDSGIFDGTYINRLLEEHIAGKADHNYRIWILINLEIWHRLYFENETVDSTRAFIDRISTGN